MDQFVYAPNFRELVAYRRAFNVSRRIIDLSKGFPAEEKYALTSHFARAHESLRMIPHSKMKMSRIPYSPNTDY
jgi:hypothetical protein